jgi:hypothetical protein
MRIFKRWYFSLCLKLEMGGKSNKKLMARTITQKTKGKAKEKPKRDTAQEPRKGERGNPSLPR